jgi:hypothetical protein
VIEADIVLEDPEDEGCNFNEDELCEQQKLNSIQCIQEMCITLREKFRFHIPLCLMVYMPLVRSTLALDIKRLEAKFTHGYRIGANVFLCLTNH